MTGASMLSRASRYWVGRGCPLLPATNPTWKNKPFLFSHYWNLHELLYYKWLNDSNFCCDTFGGLVWNMLTQPSEEMYKYTKGTSQWWPNFCLTYLHVFAKSALPWGACTCNTWWDFNQDSVDASFEKKNSLWPLVIQKWPAGPVWPSHPPSAAWGVDTVPSKRPGRSAL